MEEKGWHQIRFRLFGLDCTMSHLSINKKKKEMKEKGEGWLVE
jgi:hypothetical protein